MSQLLEKAQQFVDALKVQVTKRDPEVSISAELFGNSMRVFFNKHGNVVDSYTLIEHLDGTVEAVRDWNGVL